MSAHLRWTIGRSGSELYVSEGPMIDYNEYVEVMPVVEHEAEVSELRAAVERWRARAQGGF